MRCWTHFLRYLTVISLKLCKAWGCLGKWVETCRIKTNILWHLYNCKIYCCVWLYFSPILCFTVRNGIGCPKVTTQTVTSNVQSVPRQSPDIYWHAELYSRRPCSVHHDPHSECILCWPSSNHQLCGDCLNARSFSLHRDFLNTLYETLTLTYKALYLLRMILRINKEGCPNTTNSLVFVK
jgi:hypothetical protein